MCNLLHTSVQKHEKNSGLYKTRDGERFFILFYAIRAVYVIRKITTFMILQNIKCNDLTMHSC